MRYVLKLLWKELKFIKFGTKRRRNTTPAGAAVVVIRRRFVPNFTNLTSSEVASVHTALISH